MKKLTVITILAMMITGILSGCGVPSSMQSTGERHEIPDESSTPAVVYNEPDQTIGDANDF